MRLTEALRLEAGMSVAFTGAGGKTSALSTLTAECRARVPLVVTTTTRLGLEQASIADEHRVVLRPADVGGLRLEAGTTLVVTGPEDRSQGKLLAVEPAALELLADRARREGALLAIEADGARGRRIKAPADHEPVVPEWIDVAAPLVDLTAIGERLDAEVAHRPERVAALLGLADGETLAVEHLAQLLTSAEGGLKGIPAATEVRCLLNRSRGREGEAAQVAERVLESHRCRAAIAADLRAEDPVGRVFGRIAGIVLAAGEGTRLGQVKPLATWRDRPLVTHVLEAARAGGLSPLMVVSGFEAEAVGQAVAGAAIVVHNDSWPEGQSTSVRAGLEAIADQVEGVVFLLADMPRVSAGTIRRLVEAHASGLPSIVAPVAGERRGNPVLFDRRTFSELRSLEGDQGGRSLLDRHPWTAVAADASEFFQVERPEDLGRLRRLG